MCQSVYWIKLAQNKVQMWAPMNVVTSHLDSKKGDFFILRSNYSAHKEEPLWKVKGISERKFEVIMQ
jgi:hypothetical protein